MISRYEQFTTLISGIERGIQKIERDEMVKLGYKGAYAQYLAAMKRYPLGVTAAQLCEICDKDKAAVSRVVGELEAKGLVIRESGAAYRALLTLSEEGRRVADFVCRKAQAAVDAAGFGLKAAHTLKPDAKDIGVVIGPEGGMSGEEVDALRGIGASAVTLGPRILRTETAGLCALTMVMAFMNELE